MLAAFSFCITWCRKLVSILCTNVIPSASNWKAMRGGGACEPTRQFRRGISAIKAKRLHPHKTNVFSIHCKPRNNDILQRKCKTRNSHATKIKFHNFVLWHFFAHLWQRLVYFASKSVLPMKMTPKRKHIPQWNENSTLLLHIGSPFGSEYKHFPTPSLGMPAWQTMWM